MSHNHDVFDTTQHSKQQQANTKVAETPVCTIHEAVARLAEHEGEERLRRECDGETDAKHERWKRWMRKTIGRQASEGWCRIREEGDVREFDVKQWIVGV